jgi:hypothetical protein
MQIKNIHKTDQQNQKLLISVEPLSLNMDFFCGTLKSESEFVVPNEVKLFKTNFILKIKYSLT